MATVYHYTVLWSGKNMHYQRIWVAHVDTFHYYSIYILIITRTSHSLTCYPLSSVYRKLFDNNREVNGYVWKLYIYCKHIPLFVATSRNRMCTIVSLKHVAPYTNGDCTSPCRAFWLIAFIKALRSYEWGKIERDIKYDEKMMERYFTRRWQCLQFCLSSTIFFFNTMSIDVNNGQSHCG